jgi:hypothetical protein
MEENKTTEPTTGDLLFGFSLLGLVALSALVIIFIAYFVLSSAFSLFF